MQLYREANDYWAAKDRTTRQNWLNNQRKILLKKSPKEWESYINQQLKQYLEEHYVQQSHVNNWISDKDKLLCELWRNEEKRQQDEKKMEEMEKMEKIKKMEQMERRTRWKNPPPRTMSPDENFDPYRSGLYYMRQYGDDYDDDVAAGTDYDDDDD